jgi:hypothetical protein
MKRLLSIFLPVLVFLFPHLGVGQPTNHPLRTISVEVTVPNPTWRVAIQEVYVKGDRLLVVSTLSRDPDSMAAQVISKASDSVRIPAPDYPVEHYILGRTFRWAKEPHHFPQDRAELQKILQSAKKIYSRPPAP